MTFRQFLSFLYSNGDSYSNGGGGGNRRDSWISIKSQAWKDFRAKPPSSNGAAAATVRDDEKRATRAAQKRRMPAITVDTTDSTPFLVTKSAGSASSREPSDTPTRERHATVRSVSYRHDKENRDISRKDVSLPLLPPGSPTRHHTTDILERYTLLKKRYDDTERKANDEKKEYEQQLREAESKLKDATQQLEKARRDMAELRTRLKQQINDDEARRKLLEERTAELKVARVFIDQTDSLSGADVISLVNKLNTEIFQSAASIADTLEFTARVEQTQDDWIRAANSTHRIIGDELARAVDNERKRQKPGDRDPTLVQLALQTCMTLCCEKIMTAWSLGERDEWMKKLYASVREKENRLVSRRWRSMTRAHIRDAKDSNYWAKIILEQTCDVLSFSGCVPMKRSLLAKTEKRASTIATLAIRLQTSIGEEITSMDIEPFVVAPSTMFNTNLMEDTFAMDGKTSREPISGTTGLGLIQLVEGASSRVLVKAKVVLCSTLDE